MAIRRGAARGGTPVRLAARGHASLGAHPDFFVPPQRLAEALHDVARRGAVEEGYVRRSCRWRCRVSLRACTPKRLRHHGAIASRLASASPEELYERPSQSPRLLFPSWLQVSSEDDR